MAIPLDHYVYSSMGGYKTLYASPSIPKELSRSLEELSVHIYRLADKHDVFACFRPDEQTVCLVRAFQNRTDHASRTMTGPSGPRRRPRNSHTSAAYRFSGPC